MAIGFWNEVPRCFAICFVSSHPASQFHDAEVYMPGEVAFPLASAAETALKELDDPRLTELHDIDAVPVPFVDSEIKRHSKGLCDLCPNAQERRHKRAQWW